MGILGEFVDRIYSRLVGLTLLPKLIRRGLVVGKNFHMLDHVIIDPGHCWHITIGEDVTLATGVHIYAHDASTKMFLNYTKLGKVSIGNRVFIGAHSTVLPGVTIGNDVIVGACSLISTDIPDGVIAAGNPATVIGTLKDFLSKRSREMKEYPCFGEEYTLSKNVSPEMKDEMNRRMKDRFGFIV